MILMPAIIGQLWRFLVASAVCPGLWVTEERTDEGERVKYESRQLGGFQMCCRRGDEDEGRSKAVWCLQEQLFQQQWRKISIGECCVKGLRGRIVYSAGNSR